MDCESIPSCEELGYTQEGCSGGKGVRCPFDENKFYCAGVKQLPDAPEPVVTPEDWSAECADKIEYCTAYNTDCKCTACQEGYLLSDGACVPECDKSADTCATESKIFNAETCTCEDCPTNYLFVNGVCKKMCTIVENCKTYDSEYDPCNCTACEDGYELSNGVCIDPCPTDSSCCKYTHRVKNPSTRVWETVTENVTCYRNCQEVNSDYLDAEPENYSCSEHEIYIGAGYASKAGVTQCYYDCTCSLTASKCAKSKQIFNSETCTCEACPNNQTFDEDGKFCRTCEGMQKEGTCAVGETFVPWSKYEDGSVCGTCISCKDENNKYNPCKGKYTCDGGGRYPIGETSCTCGTIPYYEKCGVEETCFAKYPYDNLYEDEGGTCKGIQASGDYYFRKAGYYAVKKACATIEGKTLYHMAYCNQTSKDCAGNDAPAAGLELCGEGGVGDPVECGGKEFYAECIKDSCEETIKTLTENGGSCGRAVLEGGIYDNDLGYYRVKERCAKTIGTNAGKTVYWVARCSQTSKDCAGNDAPAAGLKTCSAGGIGDPIECGDEKYYTECKDEDPCQITYLSNTENGGVCDRAVLEGGIYDNGSGYYRVKEKCTKTNGKKVYWITKCNVAKDCNGEVPEAAGLTECSIGEFGYGTIVKCSGKTFATTCLKTCNAEKTEADCIAEGKTFVFKCNDNNGKSWGECS